MGAGGEPGGGRGGWGYFAGAGGAGASEGADSVTITLRIDPRMLARIKRVARSRYLNYQSMIKQWLSERMEHELRDR